MDKKIRIGVIGTGFARLTQIPAFIECPGAEVVSVASAGIENAKKVATEFEIAHYTNDWRETVARDDVDLISITTPPNLHLEMTSLAFDYGKHVLCEKPMAMNTAEAGKMTDLARETGLMALIDHELRFLNGRQKAYQMIREGQIGKVLHFKQMFRNSIRGTHDVPWNWWSDSDAGGGALGAIGSHAIDSFRWFLDTEITDIFCLLKTNIKERIDSSGTARKVTSDDEANMILKFADSALTENATGAASFSMVESGKYDFNTKIFGTKGGLMIGESGELWISEMKDGRWTEIEIELGEAPPNTKVGGWSRGFMTFAQKIVNALKEGRTSVEHAATFEDGLEIQKVLDAARESNESGRMIEV